MPFEKAIEEMKRFHRNKKRSTEMNMQLVMWVDNVWIKFFTDGQFPKGLSTQTLQHWIFRESYMVSSRNAVGVRYRRGVLSVITGRWFQIGMPGDESTAFDVFSYPTTTRYKARGIYNSIELKTLALIESIAVLEACGDGQYEKKIAFLRDKLQELKNAYCLKQ